MLSARTRTAALAALSCAGLLLATAAPASAAPDDADVTELSGPHHWMYTDDSTPGGRVDFYPDGDHFKVCDIQADGWAVEADIHDSGYNKSFRLYVGGNGTCVTSHASDGGDHNLTEGVCYTVVIFLYKSDHSTTGTDTARWLNDNVFKVNC